MKKILIVCYCVLFFGSCVFFSAGMFIPGASSAAEGAGDMPELFTDGAIDEEFGDKFEEWFSKSFAYRNCTVDALHMLYEKCFRTGSDKVVVGKDGFLFFSETLADYTGSDPMTDGEIAAAADALLRIQEYSIAHGAKFIFLCAPNKNSIYGDKMPGRYIRMKGESNLDRLLDALDESGVCFLDVRPALKHAAESALVYHKRDTHWNGIGALCAFEETARALGVSLPDFSAYDPHTVYDFEGDLDAQLYPGRNMTGEDTAYDFSEAYAYTSAYSTPMDMSISTRSGGEGKALIFRDSFANALIGYASVTFAETRFERATPFSVDMLEAFDADYVIVETAERNIRNLIGADSRID